MKSTKKYKVGLYSLPPYQPVYIHPATPYLAGHLKSKVPDIEVHQEDLNTSSLDYFLGQDLTSSMQDIKLYKDFSAFKKAKREIAEKISEKTSGILTIERNSINYLPPEDYKSRQGLLDAVKTKEKNTYYYFFKERVIPQIEQGNINFTGLSVIHQKQMIPAIILASMIKEKFGNNVKIALGGNIITRNYDVLSRDDELNKKLFDYFDYLVHHEGETALSELVKSLKEDKSFSKVPKLVYKKEGKVAENLEFVIEDPNAISMPDYEGLIAQANHWTPLPVIPYLIGRGCNWGACSFCDIPTGYDISKARIEQETGKKFSAENQPTAKRRVQNLEKVIAELQQLSEKYNTKYFSFSDEELSGDLLRDFIEKIEKSGLNIEWECFGRIEDLYLDKEFCEKLGKTGCRFIQFGIESASQKVLDANKKGYAFETAREVLKNTYKAGIMNHAFILTGLPGDSLIESSKLIEFLEESSQHLTTIKPISYKVSKWSPIALHPEDFRLSLDKASTPDLELKINVNENSGMMSRHKSIAFTRLLELWIAKNHKVNPVTSEYMYSQRLFLTRDELESFAKNEGIKLKLSKKDTEMIAKVYNGLIEEIKLFAYSKDTEKSERSKFENLYKKLKKKRNEQVGLEQAFQLCKEVTGI
ncbi:MAG: radical SAM protein [archaeon]